MILYPTQSHYPDTAVTSHFPILVVSGVVCGYYLVTVRAYDDFTRLSHWKTGLADAMTRYPTQSYYPHADQTNHVFYFHDTSRSSNYDNFLRFV